MKFGLFFSAICSLSVVADGAQFRDDVVVLMYETDASLQHDPKSPLHFFQQRGKVANLQTTVFGGKLAYHGFGDKYQTLKPLLEVADKDKLVILADARDVILNVPDNEAFASIAVDNFVNTYKKLTADAPNAVVMSAEAQCCVSAMAHAHPRDYFDPVTKERKSRACSSGKSDCLWYPSKNLDDWQEFMEDLAFDTTGEDLSDVYLNAGLMVGYPADLMNLLNVLNIDAYEDDQAVLSGLMYHFPDMIKLDYKQEMFGNNQWPRGLVDGCVFDTQGEHLPLIHTETTTEPLIIHTPGKFYDCLDVLIEDLGGVSQQRYLFDVEHMNKVATSNGFSVTTSDKEEISHHRALAGTTHGSNNGSNLGSNLGSNYGGNYGSTANYFVLDENALNEFFRTYYPDLPWESLEENKDENYIEDDINNDNSRNYGNGDNYGMNCIQWDNSARRRRLRFGARMRNIAAMIKSEIAAIRGVPEVEEEPVPELEEESNYGVAELEIESNYRVVNYGNYGIAIQYGDCRRRRRKLHKKN